MTETLHAVEPENLSVVIEENVPCFRCGYNVRGLPGDGVCPECGAAVEESLRRHSLAERGMLPMDAADPRWVRQIAWSSTLIVLSIVAVLVWDVISRFELKFPRWFLTTTYLGPSSLLAIGAWMSSGREPSPAGRYRERWLRLLIRVGVIGWIASFLCLWRVASTGNWDSMHFWRAGVLIAAALLSWSFYWRQRTFASRLSHRPLQRLCLGLAFLIPAAILTLLHPHTRSIEVEEDSLFFLISDPIVGDARLPILFVRSIVNLQRFDALTAYFSVFAVIVVTCVATLTWLCVHLWSAARRSASGLHAPGSA